MIDWNYGAIRASWPTPFPAPRHQHRYHRGPSGTGHSGRHPLNRGVEEDNSHARRLYERLGFIRVGETGSAWRL